MSDEPKTEEAKRLPNKSEILRELFLKSGNLCAFPGCSQPIMNQDGVFVGQICHIEAAEEGGERFNKNQTNEDRRAFSNLMLMCYEHHQVTNDVAQYDVKRLQGMKEAHEKKVFDFIEKTLLIVTDHTKLNNPRLARDCSRLNRLLGWGHNAEDLAHSTKSINELLTNLSKVPLPARKLFLVIIERARPEYSHYEMVLTREVQLACNLENDNMSSLCAILEKYGLIENGEEDDYGNGRIFVPELNGWPVWKDLRALVAAGYATLSELIVDLNFSLLDEPVN